MRLFFYVIFYGLIVNTSTHKQKAVNVAVETVFEFDKSNLDNDVRMINLAKNFLDKVKNVITGHHVDIDTRKTDYRLTDFIKDTLGALLTYNDEDLVDAVVITTDVIRRFNYDINDIINNENMRRSMIDNLNTISELSAKKLRKKLNVVYTLIGTESFTEAQRRSLDALNSIYSNYSKDGYKEVIDNIKQFNIKSKRVNIDLVDIIKNGIKIVVFDYYKKLNSEGKTQLRTQLKTIWDEFRKKNEAENQWGFNDILNKADKLLNKVQKVDIVVDDGLKDLSIEIKKDKTLETKENTSVEKPKKRKTHKIKENKPKSKDTDESVSVKREKRKGSKKSKEHVKKDRMSKEHVKQKEKSLSIETDEEQSPEVKEKPIKRIKKPKKITNEEEVIYIGPENEEEESEDTESPEVKTTTTKKNIKRMKEKERKITREGDKGDKKKEKHTKIKEDTKKSSQNIESETSKSMEDVEREENQIKINREGDETIVSENEENKSAEVKKDKRKKEKDNESDDNKSLVKSKHKTKKNKSQKQSDIEADKKKSEESDSESQEDDRMKETRSDEHIRTPKNKYEKGKVYKIETITKPNKDVKPGKSATRMRMMTLYEEPIVYEKDTHYPKHIDFTTKRPKVKKTHTKPRSDPRNKPRSEPRNEPRSDEMNYEANQLNRYRYMKSAGQSKSRLEPKLDLANDRKPIIDVRRSVGKSKTSTQPSTTERHQPKLQRRYGEIISKIHKAAPVIIKRHHHASKSLQQNNNFKKLSTTIDNLRQKADLELYNRLKNLEKEVDRVKTQILLVNERTIENPTKKVVEHKPEKDFLKTTEAKLTNKQTFETSRLNTITTTINSIKHLEPRVRYENSDVEIKNPIRTTLTTQGNYFKATQKNFPPNSDTDYKIKTTKKNAYVKRNNLFKEMQVGTINFKNKILTAKSNINRNQFENEFDVTNTNKIDDFYKKIELETFSSGSKVTTEPYDIKAIDNLYQDKERKKEFSFSNLSNKMNYETDKLQLPVFKVRNNNSNSETPFENPKDFDNINFDTELPSRNPKIFDKNNFDAKLPLRNQKNFDKNYFDTEFSSRNSKIFDKDNFDNELPSRNPKIFDKNNFDTELPIGRPKFDKFYNKTMQSINDDAIVSEIFESDEGYKNKDSFMGMINNNTRNDVFKGREDVAKRFYEIDNLVNNTSFGI